VRDNETGRLISETKDNNGDDIACYALSYPNEQEWVSQNPAVKPAVKVFQHLEDGWVDTSCTDKLKEQLDAHGYRQEDAFIVSHNPTGDQVYDPLTEGLPWWFPQGLDNHLWQEQYNQPILDFFKKHSVK
jgi:hypothetical protein